MFAWAQHKVLKGMAGTPTDECAYVASTVTDLPYFSSKAGVKPQVPLLVGQFLVGFLNG